MHIPKIYSVNDREKLYAFIRQNSFAILASTNAGELIASHLPLLLKDVHEPFGKLVGHMARDNSQWKQLDGGRILAIFSGPHAYISPIWYEVPGTVPTWNYVSVHVYGEIRFEMNSQKIREQIFEMLSFYGETLNDIESPDSTVFERRLQSIVSFTIEIKQMEGKWKLGQKHPIAMREKAIAALSKIDTDNCRAIAQLMQDTLKD